MPGGVITTLLMAISLYMFSSLVITGMVCFDQIDTETPFVSAFRAKEMYWAALIVAVGTVLCMVSTILTALVGLPRILFQMSKDGLLWEAFFRLNRFKVPYIGTVIFGAISCAVSFMNLSEISDMICFGVLLNYSLINMSVIALRFADTERKMERRHIIMLIATVLSCILVGIAFHCPNYHIVAPICLVPFFICIACLYKMMPVSYLTRPPVDSFLTPLVPFLPCFGTLLNVVMLLQLGYEPLYQVAAWLGAGSIIYFAYGIRHSKLNFVTSTDQLYY
jgi:amino acid transporter